jgi:hypothetical protein
MSATHVLLATTRAAGGRPGPPAPIRQPPLAPFDGPQPPDNLPVATVLPGNLVIPARPTLRFHRSNAFAVTIPGLPHVPGDGQPGMLLTWFLDRYPLDVQTSSLLTYGQRGYTHFPLSWPDSRAFGQSEDQFVATCQRVQQAGQYAGVFFGSKDFDPMNDDVNGWPSRCDSLVDKLIAARAIDYAMPAWEWNLWNVPGDQTYAIFRHFGDKLTPAGVPLYYHGGVENIAWQADGENTASFYQHLVGVLTGCLYQADVSWTPGMMQARLNDVTDRFGGNFGFPTDSGFGHPFDCIAWELNATAQFYGQQDEGRGNLTGYEALCTAGPIPVYGYGNGACRPDGTYL